MDGILYLTNNNHKSMDNYIDIEYYIDVLFEKDITTKYKPKQKGVRKVDANIELLIEEDEPKKVTKKKVKKIPDTLILEEAEEEMEGIEGNKDEEKEKEELEEVLFPEENKVFEIEVANKRKTRKKIVRANPPGKRITKKLIKLPDNIEIL